MESVIINTTKQENRQEKTEKSSKERLQSKKNLKNLSKGGTDHRKHKLSYLT